MKNIIQPKDIDVNIYVVNKCGKDYPGLFKTNSTKIFKYYDIQKRKMQSIDEIREKYPEGLERTYTDSHVTYFKLTLMGEKFECNSVECSEIELAESLTKNGVQCPQCGRGFSIKIVENFVYTIFPSEPIDCGNIEVVVIPELPSKRRERFRSEYSLSEESAEKLTKTKEIAGFFESLATEETGSEVATFIADELLGELHYRDMEISDIKLQRMEPVISAFLNDEFTDKQVTSILRKTLDSDISVSKIIDEHKANAFNEKTHSDVISKILDEEKTGGS